MLSLDDLLAPITPEVFHADYDDRKPLHIPAAPGAAKQTLLDWDRFNALLDQTSIWSSQSLKVLYNGQRVPPPRYCHDAATGSGTANRPSPAKVKVLLGQGASLVLDEVQDLVPSIRALTPALGRAFAGQVSANLYCSFGGVKAFGTHFDLHHVFAVQCEGEKVWTLYSNRADAPTTFPIDNEETRAWLAAQRGPVMTQVHMRPGDVLYLPRGWYHDALATDGASLHVTYSITPADGRTVFDILKRLTQDEATFRHFLRPAGSEILKAQLADLGRRLSALAVSDVFADEIAMAQERLIPREPGYALPHRPTLTLYGRGQGPAPAVAGPAAGALDWALSQPRLALEDMIAQFDFVPEADLRAMIDAAVRTGALVRL
ncbi:JmjC domain-containing protein [Brevundimonas sp. SL161]|uniref:JmjC domain-containing protein n=1 Tax=Brevundimonas sp. SL161 TaxID=2804613 RepID=UPI003CEA83F7